MPQRISVDAVEPDPSKTVIKEPPKVSVPISEPGSNAEILAPSTGHKIFTKIDEELEASSSSSAVSAFCAYPQGLQFSGKVDDEEVILFMRAHIVTNVPWILLVIILLILPITVVPVLFSMGALPTLSIGVSIVLTLFWYLGIFSYSLLKFLYWCFNVYIVTNERVVDVDWYSVINRDVTTAQIRQIQDVKGIQSGVFAGIFDFGIVYIQTAGTEPNFEYTNVPHPQLVVKKIQELKQQEEIEGENNL